MNDQIDRSQDLHAATPSSQAEPTRRGLLARNVKTIAIVAAGAILTKLSPAKALPNPICFLKGTKIRTVEGERCVEALAVGDLLPTVFGGVRPIKQIARIRRTRADASEPWQMHTRPVRIMKSALAPNVPKTDLFVTQAHALLIDGVLVTASSLINGTTVALYAADEYDLLEFFHIQLETHDAIFAEGAPCETLFGDGVDGSAGRIVRHGSTATQDAYCAPIFGHCARSEINWRVHSAMSWWLGPHKVEVIRERLEARSQEAQLGAS